MSVSDLTWLRVDCPHWRKMGRPVFAVAVNAKRDVVACARVVWWAKGKSWYWLKRELQESTDPKRNAGGAFTYEVHGPRTTIAL